MLPMLLPSFLWTLLKRLGEKSFKGSKRGNWSRRYVPANKTKTAFEAVFVLLVEMAGIEPASEKMSACASTVCSLPSDLSDCRIRQAKPTAAEFQEIRNGAETARHSKTRWLLHRNSLIGCQRVRCRVRELTLKRTRDPNAMRRGFSRYS